MEHSKIDYIFQRRSIRKYTDQSISIETIELLLRAAMSAPSAVAKDPWRFIVLDSQELRKKVCEGLPNGKMLAKAGSGIIVCGDISVAHGGTESYMLQDCSAAIMNILHAAQGLGLGAVWLGIHPREERIAYLKELFELPENIIPISGIAIGYPAEEKQARNRYNPEYVHWGKW